MPETNVKRVVVTKSQAGNFVVGGSVSIGDPVENANLDRGQAYMHNITDSVKITKIEAINDENTAIYVNAGNIFDVPETAYVSSMHWISGSCDCVLGNDGSPASNTSGKFPMKIQGIECVVGGYEVAGDVVLDVLNNEVNVYVANGLERTTNIATIRSAYSLAGAIPNFPADTYIGDVEMDIDTAAYFPKTVGNSSSTGVGDMYYRASGANAQREYLQGGGLWAGSGAGFCYLDGGSALSNAYWYCLARV